MNTELLRHLECKEISTPYCDLFVDEAPKGLSLRLMCR